MNDKDPLGLFSNNDDPLGLLSGDDPLNLLSTKRKTSVVEDASIGLQQAGHAIKTGLDVIAGGAASVFGDIEAADAIYKSMDERRAAFKKKHESLDQGLGGELISAVASIPGMLMPGAETGVEFIQAGESVSNARKAALIDVAGNALGMVLPGSKALTAIGKIASGAGINMLQDVITRSAISGIADTEHAKEMFAPTVRSTLLAGALGAGVGGLHAIAGNPKADTKPKTDTDVKPDAEAPNKSVTDINVEEEAANKLVYVERRIEDAQSRLEQLQGMADRATSPERKQRVQALLEQQAEYLRELTNSSEKLQVGLNKTPEAKAKVEAESVHEQYAKIEREMDDLSTEYKTLSKKGAALSAAEKARLDDIKNRYDELVDTAEQYATKIFGEDEPTPPKQEAPVSDVVSDDFVPGRTKQEVNESILNKDVSNYSDEVLSNRINNKQAKINSVLETIQEHGVSSERGRGLLSYLDKLNSELDHYQKTPDSRGADPKATGEIQRATPELQASVKSNNLRQGLEAIAKATTTPWVNRQVANLLLKNEKIGKYINLHYNESIAHAAETAHSTGDITFRSPDDVSPVNYLHEGIHSATSGMLLAFRNGVKFDFETTRAINQLISINESLQGRFYAQFEKALSAVSSTSKVDIDVILKNERELLAYALSDSGVMKALNSLEWNGKSYARRLIDSVAEMLGWKDKKHRSVLEAIYESGDILIKNSEGKGLFGMQGADFVQRYTADGDVGFHFTNKLLDAATNLPNRSMLRLLNLSHIKNFWKNNRLIQETADLTESANRRAESNLSLIQHGFVSLQKYKETGFFGKMEKMEAPDGLLGSINRVSYSKIGEMIPTLLKAARDGVDLHTAFDKYGVDSWSPEQKHLATVISNTTKKMFELANESLISRGLPPIKDWGQGYLPTHTNGKFYVDVYFNGEILRREWYLTKTQAEAAQNALSGDKRVTTKVSKKEDGADYDSIDSVLREALEVTKNHEKISLNNWINGKLEEIALKNSNIGGHKQHKDLLRGFAGDKVGKTVEQQGKEFAQALEQWTREYVNAIRKREIQHDIAKWEATNPVLVKQNPNAHEIMRYAVSKEIGELGSFMKIAGHEGKVSEMINQVANEVAVRMGMKNLDRDILPYTYSILTRGAYNMVLTMAPVTWVTQTLGFMNAQRMYFKYPDANPLHAAEAASKGLFKILFKQYDDELLQALHYVSQNFETLHKHLSNEIAEYQWQRDKHHIASKVRRLVTGETFTTGGDAISRMIAFSQAVEFLKLQGKSGEKMWIEAARMTDDNMNAFGRKNLAGIYDELGAAGTLIAPLKSFIHHQAGNLAIDLKDLVMDRSVNSALALTANMLSMMLMGGLLSAPFLADYEYLRNLLVQAGVIAEDALPNWTQMAEKMDPTLSRGLLSGATGIDMGASMRYQSVFKPFGDIVGADNITGIAFPLSVTSKALEGGAAVAKNIFGDAPTAEILKASENILPRGIPRGIRDMVFLDSTENPVTIGKRGQKLTDRTTNEYVAKMIGSRTVEEAHASTMNRQLDVHNKHITARKQKAVDLILSPGRGDREAGQKILRELVQNRQWSFEEASTAIQNVQMSKMRGANESAILSNSGQMTKQNMRNYEYLQRMERGK